MDFFKTDRQVTTNGAKDTISNVADFEHGGMNSRSLEEAIRNISTIKSTDLGKEGGIPILNHEGKVNLTDLDMAGFVVPILNYGGNINPGSVYRTSISNYDSLTRYSVSVDAGNLEVEGKNITIAVPENYNEETFNIHVNGYTSTIKVNIPKINKPIIKNISNDDMVYKDLVVEFSDFVVSYGKGNEEHASTDIQLATDEGFTDLLVNLEGYTTTRTSYAFNNLAYGGSYYLRVRYNSDEITRPSVWSDVIHFTVHKVVITKPAISYPVDEATNILNERFRIKSSAFATNETAGTNPTNIHNKTEVQISTDTTFLNPIKTINYTGSNLVNFITSVENTRVGKVYMRLRYHTSNGNRSAWSDVVSFTFTKAVTDGANRKFYRHESGMGTVMIWMDKTNKERRTLVLDAQYRNRLRWASSDINVTDIRDFNQGSTGYYPSGAAVNTTATSIPFTTDTIINSNTNYREDAQTSRQNTTAMLKHSQCQTTTYAAGWCRSKSLTHEGKTYSCDLPNIQTLVRIFYSMFKLDELDPTPRGNVYLFTKARSGLSYNWYLGNNSNYSYSSWSSSEPSSNNAYPHTMHYNGMLYSSAHVTKSGHYCGTIPVLELENL